MRTRRERRLLGIAVALVVVATGALSGAPPWRIVGWNNLGMHCMDADYSVFSILPPYNTIHAQLIDSVGQPGDRSGRGRRHVTYEAVADPDGSINTTSSGKTNFWQHVQALFGVALPVDTGLAGNTMPGAANVPQPMTFDPAFAWFIAEGIPITPYDDAQHQERLPDDAPLRRATRAARCSPRTDIVLPVSDEMDCRACHASGSATRRKPAAGWVNDCRSDARLQAQHPAPPRRAAGRRPRLRVRARGGGLLGRRALSRPPRDGTSDPLRPLPRLERAARARGIAGIEPLTQAVHAPPRRRHRPGHRPDARRHRQPLRLLSLSSRAPRRAACAASWATRSPPTARSRSSARAATAR